MQWATYKVLCDQPDYWSRWMLEQCIDLLFQMGKDELSALLKKALLTPKLLVPDDHCGGRASEMYQLRLVQSDRLSIGAAIEEASRRGLTTKLTQKRGLAGFVPAWREYIDYES